MKVGDVFQSKISEHVFLKVINIADDNIKFRYSYGDYYSFHCFVTHGKQHIELAYIPLTLLDLEMLGVPND